jgi:uncharacterized integral membrane protein
MNLRALAVGLVLALSALFAVLNWAAFTAPTALTLGFADVNAPLGLIMLVLTALVSGLFLVYIVFQQAGVILEARRYAKDLKTQRELADKAEASRFTELRGFLDGELRRIEGQGAASTREVVARVEQLERKLEDKFAETSRTLSAYIGEVDDKLDRLLPPPRD